MILRRPTVSGCSFGKPRASGDDPDKNVTVSVKIK